MTASPTTRERAAPDERKRRTRPTAAPWRRTPRAGDVLVSRRSARADVYAITVMAGADASVATRYEDAVRRVDALARERGVDGWYTSDHTHFVRIARHRPASRSNGRPA